MSDNPFDDPFFHPGEEPAARKPSAAREAPPCAPPAAPRKRKPGVPKWLFAIGGAALAATVWMAGSGVQQVAMEDELLETGVPVVARAPEIWKDELRPGFIEHYATIEFTARDGTKVSAKTKITARAYELAKRSFKAAVPASSAPSAMGPGGLLAKKSNEAQAGGCSIPVRYLESDPKRFVVDSGGSVRGPGWRWQGGAAVFLMTALCFVYYKIYHG